MMSSSHPCPQQLNERCHIPPGECSTYTCELSASPFHFSRTSLTLDSLQAQLYITVSTQYEPKISIPPPLPTNDQVEDQATSRIPRSHDASRLFYHLCKLSIYASRIFLVVRDTSGSSTPPPLAFALQQYERLLEFIDGLPAGMRRSAGADYAPVLDFQ